MQGAKGIHPARVDPAVEFGPLLGEEPAVRDIRLRARQVDHAVRWSAPGEKHYTALYPTVDEAVDGSCKMLSKLGSAACHRAEGHTGVRETPTLARRRAVGAEQVERLGGPGHGAYAAVVPRSYIQAIPQGTKMIGDRQGRRHRQEQVPDRRRRTAGDRNRDADGRRRRRGRGRPDANTNAGTADPAVSDAPDRELRVSASGARRRVLPSSSVGEESLSPNHPDTSSRF